MKVIVSMATIPSRKNRLKENLPSILNQSYPFDNLMLNILDNLSDEDYSFYEELQKMDNRIILNKVEQKWRSCNKLLPALKLYPDDIMLTLVNNVNDAKIGSYTAYSIGWTDTLPKECDVPEWWS